MFDSTYDVMIKHLQDNDKGPMYLKSIKYNNDRYIVIPASGSWYGVGIIVSKWHDNTWISIVVNSLGNRLAPIANQWPLLLTWFNFNPSMNK